MTSRPAHSYYVLRSGQTIGPISGDDLSNFVKRGVVRSDDQVWRHGLQDWTALEDTPEFQSFPALDPPPLPRDWSIDRPTSRHLKPSPIAAKLAVENPDQISSINLDSRPSESPTSELPTPIPAPSERVAPSENQQNYLARHWRGHLSLPVSYWFNGFLGYAISTILVTLISASSALKVEFSPALALSTLIAAWVVTAAVTCWLIVGIWRSATEHSRITTKMFWPATAKVSLCVAAAVTLVQFGSRGVPQIKAMYNIYSGDSEIGKYTFRILRDGAELEFSGGITFGAAKEFTRFVEAMGALRVVHLNSPGGRIEEAQRIGNLIKKKNLDTYVARSCLSACTIIFLSGKKRFITRDASIGFHQPDFAGLSQAERLNLARNEEIRLEGFGLSPSFAKHANQVPPDDIWTPSVAELLNERVATEVVSPSTFAVSGLDSFEITPEGADTLLRGIPIYAALARANATAYQEVVDGVVEGLRRGKSASELMIDIAPIVDRAFERTLPQTAPAVLTEYAEMMLKHLKLLDLEDPAACFAYLNPHRDDSQALLNKASARFPTIPDDQRKIKEDVFNSYAIQSPLPANNDDTNATLTKIFILLEKRLGKDAGLITKPDVPATELQRYCTATIAFYDEILRLPSSGRIAVLRTLFSKN